MGIPATTDKSGTGVKFLRSGGMTRIATETWLYIVDRTIAGEAAHCITGFSDAAINNNKKCRAAMFDLRGIVLTSGTWKIAGTVVSSSRRCPILVTHAYSR